MWLRQNVQLIETSVIRLSCSRRTISFRKLTHMYRNFWLPNNPKPPYDHVCQIGDPVLRTKASVVNPEDIKSERIQLVIKKLRSVLRGYDAVGIAAPQIGVPLRIFAVEFPESRMEEFSKEVVHSRKMSTFPFKVFINPGIKVLDYTKISFPEACESVKGFSAVVPRFSEVLVTGLNERGEAVEWKCKGWPARICQHEMEHLDGKMFIDSMEKGSLEFPLWQRVNYRSGRIYLTYAPHK
ncbi:peptide deformylase, mitochondrial-like [Ischnura elegans]|uniref:peptide deformylase, mitochondrial-like n=1 Tax=Ischnura elegans TaxID=197161 RepID=UPI001ED8B7C3|nr:peptide deformylase, mitochondrial-like [Ischnura elegans]XP_046397619.1 peptide deformylase, mitochondrial-like [Ischnura elegans]